MSGFCIVLLGLLTCLLGLAVLVHGLEGGAHDPDRLLFAAALQVLVAVVTIVWILLSFFGWSL